MKRRRRVYTASALVHAVLALAATQQPQPRETPPAVIHHTNHNPLCTCGAWATLNHTPCAPTCATNNREYPHWEIGPTTQQQAPIGTVLTGTPNTNTEGTWTKTGTSNAWKPTGGLIQQLPEGAYTILRWGFEPWGQSTTPTPPAN